MTKGLGGAFLPGGSDLSTGQVVGGTVVSAIIGGTASVISGGKFANGARTASFQFLFNQLGRIFRDVIMESREAAIRRAIDDLKTQSESGLGLDSAEVGAGRYRVGTYVYEDKPIFWGESEFYADGRVNSNGGAFYDLGGNVGAGGLSEPSNVSDWILTVSADTGHPNLQRLEAQLGGAFNVKSIYTWNTDTNVIQHWKRNSVDSNLWR